MTAWLALLLILVAAFVIRVEGIELRGMTHVEVYVPGIDLPKGIAEPPPRIGIMDTLSWHWHSEPHPQGYFFSMWPWTKLFGTELGTLRLPIVILGTGTVLLTFLLAARLFGTWVGLASALLVTLNGHQIYWSQMARPYGMATFLGVLSTFLLTELLLQKRRQTLKEIAYVAVTWMGVFTQIFFWPFLAGQMLFAAWYVKRKDTEVPRILKLQSIVAILGTPLWAHAIYNSREITLGYPSLEFVQQFLTFAFLFQPDHLSIPARYVSLYITVPLTIIALVLLVLGLRDKRPSLPLNPRLENADFRSLVPIAAGLVVILLALAWYAWRRQLPMAMTAVVPILACLAIPLAGRPLNSIHNFVNRALGDRPLMSNGVALLVMCCFIPTLLLFLIALARPLIMDRGFLMLTPYLIILLALGLRKTASIKPLFLLLVIVLGAAHAYSMYFYRTVPGANDYRLTAEQIITHAEPGDLIFVPRFSWVTTPLFYHMQDDYDRLVAGDFSRALEQHPDARVWLPLFSDQMPNAGMQAALQCLEIIDEYTAHRSRVFLFARPQGKAAGMEECEQQWTIVPQSGD